MGIKLVIVDDAPFIREAVRHLLEGSDIEIVGEASDGASAVKIVLSKNPDVVLMDMVLPNKNGIDATKEILAQLPKTKIIACSTESQEALVLRALDAGCKHYLSKPFQREELLNMIMKLAGGK